METLFKNNIVEILFEKENKMLIQKWGSDYAEFSLFKEAIDKTVEYFKQYDIEKLLSDTSIHPMVSNQSSNYAASVMPALIQNGMKKMAFVQSQNVFTKLGVKNFTIAAGVPFIFHFDNYDNAICWLLE